MQRVFSAYVVLINEELIGYKFTYATELEENVYFTVTVTNIYRALIVWQAGLDSPACNRKTEKKEQ